MVDLEHIAKTLLAKNNDRKGCVDVASSNNDVSSISLENLVKNTEFKMLLAKKGISLEAIFRLDVQLFNQYTVIGIDASQIYFSRHKSVEKVGLINLAATIFRYDFRPNKASGYQTEVVSKVIFQQDLVADFGQFFTVTTTSFDVLRQLYELEFAIDLAKRFQQEKNIFVLLDASLNIHSMRSLNSYQQDVFYKKYQDLLDVIKQEDLPIFSYISVPQEVDLVYAVKHFYCQASYFDKRKCKGGCLGQECKYLWDKNDAGLFAANTTIDAYVFKKQLFFAEDYLEPGSLMYFIYLFTGKEVAKIEFVTEYSIEPLKMFLCLILDQTQKGLGYPMSLIEAHELATISQVEEQVFWSLVNSANSYDEEKFLSPKQKMKQLVFG